MSSPSAEPRLTPDLASQFARIALGHVAREYPNKMDHVLDGPPDIRGPRDLHPIFFGSFDWHSCVHGYWTLATVLRLHPGIPEAAAVRAHLDQTFTAENVAGVFADAAPWAGEHQPLADAFAERFADFLPKAAYPIRTGVHSSTAFALRLAADYPLDADLAVLIRDRVADWYGDDRDAQAWEPSLDDFLSPTLMEAACMARLTEAADFRPWFAAFLPRVADLQPASLFTPALSPDRSDGKMAHLDGVNLSRAWCWREIATRLDADDPVRAVAEESARVHLAASLRHVAGDYMGEHWLASFALLALTAH